VKPDRPAGIGVSLTANPAEPGQTEGTDTAIVDTDALSNPCRGFRAPGPSWKHDPLARPGEPR
jgi:hypothetical protein